MSIRRIEFQVYATLSRVQVGGNFVAYEDAESFVLGCGWVSEPLEIKKVFVY